MQDILIRRIDDDSVRRLKARAKKHHRSVQAELRAILDDVLGGEERRSQAAREAASKRARERDQVIRWVDELRERLERDGKQFTDSVDIIREYRDR